MVQEQVDERGQELERERRGLLRIGLAEVYNPSMVPTLNPGDQILVQYGATVRPGDVVVLRHPFRQDLLIVKRAVERRAGGWWVVGDNPLVENDSREFGTVPDEFVVARARLRLRRPPGAGQRSAVALLSWIASAVRPLTAEPSSGRTASWLSRRLRAR
ncbi:nickel-type superoxide dismutase maturation protease [Streptomyces netropsis]|uniref:Nickel-type superoxide dismutase maturation protease n=1 Tax=Streptomyces syringium TaxID=76729 RepID=A0ABS4Y8K3_9ACTN|nr:nickel-type superoxide dismutase maturation protease [Streptomyces syringium]SPE58114.1 nickel-type superoxide dismutase maturation protease [Streptomyces netropsis]